MLKSLYHNFLRLSRPGFFALAMLIILFETIEHPILMRQFDLAFFIEISIQITLILVCYAMVDVAIKASVEKNQALDILDIRHNLSLKLSTSRSWEELVDFIVAYPASIASVLATSLALYDVDNQSYGTAQSWISPEERLEISHACLDNSTGLDSPLTQEAKNSGLRTCEGITTLSGKKRLCHCLPLFYRNSPIGMLRIFVQSEQGLNKDQIQIFNNIGEELAVAIYTFRQQQENKEIEIANTANAMRLGIARDLHDSLGQNLGYIHFKLDQILTNPSDRTFYQARPELEQLRTLSNESYELVRNSLIVLHHNDQHQLRDLFRIQAQLIAERGGFDVKVQEDGQPKPLPLQYINQLSFVIKEIVYNVEKHAQAHHVNIQLCWEPSVLSILVYDDGKGFNPQKYPKEGHLGLAIMRERIANLGGQFELESAENEGTHINIRLPLKNF